MSVPSSQASPVRLGWIGLGSMGIEMARNIQKHIANSAGSPPLKVYNRTASRCDGVVELGGVACQSVAQVVEGCDVVFLSVSYHSSFRCSYAIVAAEKASLKSSSSLTIHTAQ